MGCAHGQARPGQDDHGVVVDPSRNAGLAAAQVRLVELDRVCDHRARDAAYRFPDVPAAPIPWNALMLFLIPIRDPCTVTRKPGLLGLILYPAGDRVS